MRQVHINPKSKSTQSDGIARVTSGIPGLDTILNGGFVKGGVYLLLGPPGTGKTIFANQMCFHQAKEKKGSIVYVTLLAESHGRMMENLRPLKYYKEKDVSECIHYMGGYHVLEKEGLKGFLRLIAGIVKEKNASILMIDGMSTIGELEQSAITFRKFAHELNSYLATSGCTAFLLSSMEGHLSKPEHTMVDGIISFHYESTDPRVVRQIEVRKFRGSGHAYGKHLYTINNNGITVYPRLETICSTSKGPLFSKERLSFKLKGLDEMLNGGIFKKTLVTLIGSAGTGKTSLGLQFLAAGTQAGERGVFFGLYERPEELLDKANSLSIKLDRKKVDFVWHPSLELEMDEIAYNLIEKVKETGAKRVVIDGIDGIRNTVSSPLRLNRFITALAIELKSLNVTTLMVEETATFGEVKKRQLAEFSAINEVVIYLHHEEVEEEIVHALTVLKMRNSAFDKRTKQFILSDQGLKVQSLLEAPTSVYSNKSKKRTSKGGK